ncbi:TPA: hypothetical protein EYP66_01330 [Candidatus Poribacteria bacterium]|nr:hypothetical protein [Candidatus Poribacteria bacterium]
MKSLNLFLAIISIALLCMSILMGTAYAGTQIWDFEKAAQEDDWNVATGKWGIKGGVYQETSGGSPAMASFVGEEDWTDYTVEAKIRIDKGQWAGLIFRAKSDLEYYVFYFGEGNVELWKHTGPNVDSRQNLFKHPPQKIGLKKEKEDAWHDVKAVIEGDHFEFYMDGELQDDTIKDKSYPAGRIGVWAWKTAASFDDVKVTGPGIKDTTAVQPDKKLAITWGKLKVD